MSLNNILYDFNFFKKNYDHLYNTNFQFNGEFCKIRIYYNVIVHQYAPNPSLYYTWPLSKPQIEHISLVKGVEKVIS
jgi:hypothetical protein